MAELTTPAETATNSCCTPEEQATCCEPSAKADCCDPDAANRREHSPPRRATAQSSVHETRRPEMDTKSS